MSRCKRVNNACKICLQSVKPKTGLQCQGACESWVHYSCLNYSPGKIKDIQTGVITVTCPCPDCKTTVPKEIWSDPPYSCNNYKCPANMSPACEETTCQANEITNARQPPPYQPGALVSCGNECINFKTPNTYQSLPSDPCMEGFKVYGRGTDPPKGMCPPGDRGGGGGNGGGGGQVMNMAAVEKMCKTVAELTSQLNTLMTTMKQTAMMAESMGGIGRGGEGMDQPPPQQQVCVQKGPRALCPKPCNCPGNPHRYE